MPFAVTAEATRPVQRSRMGSVQAFETLLTSACVLAILVHIAFGTLFYRSGAMSMVYFNVGSVLCFVLSAWWIRHKHIGRAMVLMGTEVVAHAIAAVVVVGWDSGFHYYLIIAIPIILAASAAGWLVKLAGSGLVCAAYLVLDLHYRTTLPLHFLDNATLHHLHTFNLTTTLFALGGLTVLYVKLIHEAEQRLHELATTDTLTQLMNRRCVLDALDREQARRIRKPGPMALILVDIDHFKRLNDTWGHHMGDWALANVARILKEGVREMDFVARWGGEEFLIVLPLADVDAAWPVAERLRMSIAQLRFPSPDHPLRVTATLGLTAFGVDEAADVVIQRADAALYQGKNEGRDRVVVSGL